MKRSSFKGLCSICGSKVSQFAKGEPKPKAPEAVAAPVAESEAPKSL
jgi:hypothetical protein